MTHAFPKFGYDPVTGEWNDSLKGNYCWSNVNFGEAAPDVMTPITWSLMWIYINQTTPIHFPDEHPAGGNIAGRLYFNLSLISSLYHAVGMDARKQKFGDLLGSIPPELNIPYLPFSPLTVIWNVLPGMIKDRMATRRDIKKFSEYIAILPNWVRSVRPRIQQCTNVAALLALWTESIMPTIRRDYRMLRSVTNALSAPATKLNVDLTALVGEAEARTLLSNLSGASGDLESLGPLVGLQKVKDGRMGREEYIERYGHRGPHEGELSAPVPSQVTGADGFADHIIVYWLPNPEPDLSGYQIYRGVCDRGKFYRPSKEEMCDFMLVGDVQKSEAEKRLAQTGKIYFEDFSAPAGSSVCYAYWVRAYDHAGNLYMRTQGCPVDPPAPGAYPEYACQRLYEETPPPVPIITALKARDRAVQVEWVSAPAQDLRAFHIYRSENELDPPEFVGCVLNDGSIYPGRWTDMKPDCEDIPAEADPAAGHGTYLDQTMEPNHIYWYRVSALDWLGNESESADLTKIPAISTFTYDRGLPIPPVVRPSGVSNPDRCGLQVSWAPVFNPLAHKGILVFRSCHAGGSYRQVSPLVQADHFEDLSAPRGVDYWYRVQAMALDGTLSQPSAPVHYRY